MMKIDEKSAPSLMLIDDDPDLCDVVEAFFRPRGFVVRVYSDAEQALKELPKQNPDVILTDLQLPNMTGIQFTGRVKESGNTAPIILMTANKSVDIAIEAIEAGAYDFIVKPLHFPQLLVSVQRALRLNRIAAENETLKAAVLTKDGLNPKGIIGKSPAFTRALDLAKRVASSNANVFIHGESGTGKEVIARAIHSFGTRKDGPFIAINCSAIPENLLESELFGYVKGAFTGANDKKIGLFEEAEGGTLFLDEIGDMPLALQAKLLRVLQERKIKRLGENQDREINVRVISATHKNLRQEVAEKHFREDLFFRLNVIPLTLPPLRERREDVMPLAEFFLKKFAALNGVSVRGISKGAIEQLLSHQWPGNVRELENSIERAVVLAQGPMIEDIDLFEDEMSRSSAGISAGGIGFSEGGWPLGEEGRLLTLEELTDLYIHFAINRNGGAKDRTARELGIDRKTLYRRLQLAQTDTSKRRSLSQSSAPPLI